MGRKIPGRKHHGVRDPEKQRIQRLKKIKDKINAPPANPDEQQVPKSLQRLIALKNKAKDGPIKKKLKKPKPKKMFEQHPRESDREFLNRVNKKCALIKHEAAFEQKFGVELKRNAEGEVVEVEKKKDPIQMMLKEARKKKKKTKITEEEPKLTKSQKRRRKLVEKKRKKSGDKLEEFKQDKVEFGEQVHAPPTLTVPKKIKSENTSRPGKRDLLLKSLLDLTGSKTIDRTAKRKELPNALRRQLDFQQKEAIEAYRLMKQNKKEVIK